MFIDDVSLNHEDFAYPLRKSNISSISKSPFFFSGNQKLFTQFFSSLPCFYILLNSSWMCMNYWLLDVIQPTNNQSCYKYGFTTKVVISIFPLWTTHLYVATFQQHQLIRYSRACGSCYDFLDRRFLLIRKLMHQGFLMVKLKSSLRMFYGHHYDLVRRYGIYVSWITTYMFHLS
jgi:hypothetical protein